MAKPMMEIGRMIKEKAMEYGLMSMENKNMKVSI
jgi:hypothetical protein